MDNKKFKYTLDEFYNDVVEALGEGTGKGGSEPNVFKKLLSQAKLGKTRQEV